MLEKYFFVFDKNHSLDIVNIITIRELKAKSQSSMT